MVASSEIGWLEQVLRGHVARFMPGEGGGAVEASVRAVLTAPELSQDEQWALDEWEEGVHSGRSVGDLLLEARINAAVQLQADAMAQSLGLEETPEVPPVHVARSKEKSSDESLLASLTSAGVLQEAGGGLSVSRLTSESTFVFTDGGGYDALRHLKLDPNQTDFVEEGREAKLAEAHKALTIVQSMHGLDAVEECIKQALPRYEELAQKEPIELEEKDLTGEVLGGKYRVKRALGKGGFGTVYEAVDEMLGAPVAIKVLNPKAAGHDRALEQFLDEAKLLTNLDHPNIVRWITFDKRKDGQHYFVMEYLHGEELSEILKREGRLAPERVLEMLLEIVDALRAAHRLPDGSALYHLDLKPQNVFVVSGEPERVKVIDFGISQHVGAEAREAAGVEVMSAPDKPGQDLSATIASQVTPAVASDSRAGVTRARGGTLLYASPEQCKHLAGHADIVDLDGRSDLYSVGIMAFQLLTGDMPFQHLRTPLDAIDSHLNVAPRKPSDLKVDVPRKLADFVARCLAKDRDDRFADAEEAYAALDRIANPPSKWPWISAAAAVVVIPTALWFAFQRPLEPFNVEDTDQLVHAGPQTPSFELGISGLEAEGTEVSFWSDIKGGEPRLPGWAGEVTAAGELRIHAPEGLNEHVDEQVYLRITGKGKDQSSSDPLRIVYLGEGGWSLVSVGVQGLLGKAIDPVDAEFEVIVRAEKEAIERVDVALGDTVRRATLDGSLSTGADLYYMLGLDDFSVTERGPAVFEVTVVDRAAGEQTETEELNLEPAPLTVDATLVNCVSRGAGEYIINPKSSPVLAVEKNREADEVVEVTDADGQVLPVPATETSAGWELDFSGLTAAVTGEILVRADDSNTTHHERQARGLAEARVGFKYQTDLPSVELGSTSTLFELEGAEGYVTNESTFELSLRRGEVGLTVEAVCRSRATGEELRQTRTLDASPYGSVTFELPADGVYDILLDLKRLEAEEAEADVETFVVFDRSTRTARLEGPADAVLTRATEASFGVELHLSAPAEALALPVNVSWEARGGSQTERGTLPDLLPSADPETIQLDPATLADGTYELVVTGQDKAGNALEVPESGYVFTVAREGPEVRSRLPRNLGRSDFKDNRLQLSVDVSDPNGVESVSCTVGPPDGERTPEQWLVQAGSGSQWETEVKLPTSWVNKFVQIELTATDQKGVERTHTIDANLPIYELPRLPAITVELPGATEVSIGAMRLVEGARYDFGGRADSAEKKAFRKYGEDPKLFMRDGEDSWGIDVNPIEDFYLDTNEVTVAQFLAFVEHRQGYANVANWIEESPQETRRAQLAQELTSLDPDLPVRNVTWYEASAYASWVGKELPTFEEWEYAVRGGDAYRPHSFAVVGDSKVTEVNFGKRDSGPWEVLVGEDETPEGIGAGIRNLCSNVAEWTAFFEDSSGQADGPGTYAVGASYLDNNYYFYKASKKAPDRPLPQVGFRCALSLERARGYMEDPNPPLRIRASEK